MEENQPPCMRPETVRRGQRNSQNEHPKHIEAASPVHMALYRVRAMALLLSNISHASPAHNEKSS